MDMPFADVSDETFLELFEDFEETASGVWTFGQWHLTCFGLTFELRVEPDEDPDQAQFSAAVYFGYHDKDA